MFLFRHKNNNYSNLYPADQKEIGVFKVVKSTSFIVLFALTIAFFTSVLASSGSVSAQAGNNGGNSTMNGSTAPNTRAQSYTYYKLGEKCVQSHMRNTIKTTAGQNGVTSPKQSGAAGSDGTSEGEWFADDAAFGYVYPDGKVTCGQLFQKALPLWGWTSGADFLRAMGYTFDTSVPEYRSATNDGNQRADRFRSAVNGRVGNVTSLADDAAMHILYLRAFGGAEPYCQGKRVADYNGADATLKGWADNNSVQNGLTYAKINVTEGSTSKEYIYTYDSDNGENVGQLWRYRGDGWGHDGVVQQYSCDEIASRISQTAAALRAWNGSNPTQPVGAETPPTGVTPVTGEGEGDTQSSCVIEGVGWLICPAFTFLAGVVDAAYEWVSSMLSVQPLLTTGESAGVYNAWTVMRTVANVAFTIAFLIIIFSQLTGVGVSNYGVKKLLPRIIVSAILVNLSFWICALAVDLSNILGSSIVSAFNSIGADIRPPDEAPGLEQTGNEWTGLVTLALAGTIAYYVMLSALIPALIAAVVAVITVFLVLALRYALIILLVVIAPLAFVAFLLPNTEGWFDKWRKLLLTLLLMYPIIGAIFGASALASMIVMNSAEGNFIVQVMGAAIAIVPLAITPVVMKTAGGVLNRFAGIVNNAEKGPIDRLKRAGEGFHQSRKDLRDAKALAGQKQFGRGSFVKWRAGRAAIANRRKEERNRSNTEFIAEKTEANKGFQNAMAGGGLIRGRAKEEDLLRAQASAIGAKVKLENEEVNAASIVMKEANLTLEQTQELALSGKVELKNEAGETIKVIGGEALQTAAIQKQFKTGDISLTDQLVMGSGAVDPGTGKARFTLSQRQAIAEGAQSLSGKVKYYGGVAGDRIAQGHIQNEGDLDILVKDSIESSKFSEQDIAAQDKDALTRYARVSAIEGVNSAEFRSVAASLSRNERIYPTVEGRKQHRIQNIIEGTPFSDARYPGTTPVTPPAQPQPTQPQSAQTPPSQPQPNPNPTVAPTTYVPSSGATFAASASGGVTAPQAHTQPPIIQPNIRPGAQPRNRNSTVSPDGTFTIRHRDDSSRNNPPTGS